jgi:hypothetical protein
MTPAEIETALQAAFEQCEAAGLPLGNQQKQILLAAIALREQSGAMPANANGNASALAGFNPLDELTPEQRQILLRFVREQESQEQPWKVQLLNDWLQGQESGEMQFIRDLYGPQWLDRVQPVHVAAYADDAVLLKVGDRIEVSNNLWEWVQDDGPCSREWVPCVVTGITEISDSASTLPDSYRTYTNCTIRFKNGTEYEVQGVYEWNRYNWRWAADPGDSAIDSM